MYSVDHSPVFTHKVIANIFNIYFWRKTFVKSNLCHSQELKIFFFCLFVFGKSKETRVESAALNITIQKRIYLILYLKKKSIFFLHTNNCTLMAGVYTTSNISARLKRVWHWNIIPLLHWADTHFFVLDFHVSVLLYSVKKDYFQRAIRHPLTVIEFWYEGNYSSLKLFAVIWNINEFFWMREEMSTWSQRSSITPGVDPLTLPSIPWSSSKKATDLNCDYY